MACSPEGWSVSDWQRADELLAICYGERAIVIRRLIATAVLLMAAGWGMQANAQTPQEPAAPPSPVLMGPELFRERGCAQCHSLHGVGGHKGPDLTAVGKRMSAEKIRLQIREGGGAMPPYADALGDGELDKLVELLRRAKK